MWQNRLVQMTPCRVLYPGERSSSLPGRVGTSLPKCMQKFILVLARTLHIQEAPHSILNLKTVPQIEIWHSFPHITQGYAVKVTENKPQPFPSTSLKIHHAQPWWTLREPESKKGVYVKRTNVMQLGCMFICNCNIALHVSDAICA